MNALKPIVIILCLMCVFVFMMVPIEAGVFPAWMNADLIQFILLIFVASCALVLIL